MTHHPRHQKDQIQEILNHYGLVLRAYEQIKMGYSSPSYWVQTVDQQFVLTIFEIGLQRAIYQASLLQHLENHDFPAPRVQKTISGEIIPIFSGEPILLKPYIPGEIIEALTAPMLHQVGAAMARLHAIPAPESSPYQHAYGLQTFPNLFGHHIDPAYETWLAGRYAFYKQNISTSLPRGLIHGDIYADNLLFEGEQLKVVLDFEEACRYYLAFDLGMAMVGVCAEGEHLNLEKARLLLAGYQKIRALESEEKQGLQIFVEYAAASTSSWRYWRNNIDRPDADRANRHWQMANLARQVSSIPRGTFQAIFC